MKKKPQLLSIGEMAKRLGEPIHRVRFILESRGDIKPSALCGRTRVYDARALARVRHELAAIDARRLGLIDDVLDAAGGRGFDMHRGVDWGDQ